MLLAVCNILCTMCAWFRRVFRGVLFARPILARSAPIPSSIIFSCLPLSIYHDAVDLPNTMWPAFVIIRRFCSY